MARAHSKTRTRSGNAKPVAATPRPAQDALGYWVDAWQRGALFWDVLRERGNTYLDQARGDGSPVLVFDYRIVAHGRELLPEMHQRRQAHELVRRMAQTRGAIAPEHDARFETVARALGPDARPVERSA